MKAVWITLAAVLAVSNAAAGVPDSWETGKTFTYRFTEGNKAIGSETFSIQRTGEGFVIADRLDIRSAKARMVGDATLAIDAEAHPLAYTSRLTVDIPGMKDLSGDFVINVDFSAGGAKASRQKGGNIERTSIGSPRQSIYAFENNRIAHWAAIVAVLRPDRRERTEARVLHLNTLQEMSLLFERAGTQTLGGVETTKVRFTLASRPVGFFYIDSRGRLIRDEEQEGTLVIQLAE